MNTIRIFISRLHSNLLSFNPFVKSNNHKDSEKGRRIKSLFISYFDGCYGVEPRPNTSSTFEMGVCKLDYKDKENVLVVHLRRPGLLIGKYGSVIDAVSKYLDCNITIVEVNLNK